MGGFADGDPGQDLVGCQCSLQEAPEEVGRSHHPLTCRSDHRERGVQGQAGRREVRGGIAVGDRPADRAAMADLGIADLAGNMGQQWYMAA
jgi:hypothetical protein